MERTGQQQRELRSNCEKLVGWSDREKKEALEYIIRNVLTDSQVEDVHGWLERQKGRP